jgi:hypothetical protein
MPRPRHVYRPICVSARICGQMFRCSACRQRYQGLIHACVRWQLLDAKFRLGDEGLPPSPPLPLLPLLLLLPSPSVFEPFSLPRSLGLRSRQLVQQGNGELAFCASTWARRPRKRPPRLMRHTPTGQQVPGTERGSIARGSIASVKGNRCFACRAHPQTLLAPWGGARPGCLYNTASIPHTMAAAACVTSLPRGAHLTTQAQACPKKQAKVEPPTSAPLSSV